MAPLQSCPIHDSAVSISYFRELNINATGWSAVDPGLLMVCHNVSFPSFLLWVDKQEGLVSPSSRDLHPTLPELSVLKDDVSVQGGSTGKSDRFIRTLVGADF
jgi:hypothetical protein